MIVSVVAVFYNFWVFVFRDCCFNPEDDDWEVDDHSQQVSFIAASRVSGSP